MAKKKTTRAKPAKKSPRKKAASKKAPAKKKKPAAKKTPAAKKKKPTAKKAPAKKKKPTAKKTRAAGRATKSKPVRQRVTPAVVVKRVKQPVPADTWPTEKEWRQSGLCSEAQADGIPCTELGRKCEICERADQKDHHGA